MTKRLKAKKSKPNRIKCARPLLLERCPNTGLVKFTFYPIFNKPPKKGKAQPIAFKFDELSAHKIALKLNRILSETVA